jgi:hypothetical protein
MPDAITNPLRVAVTIRTLTDPADLTRTLGRSPDHVSRAGKTLTSGRVTRHNLWVAYLDSRDSGDPSDALARRRPALPPRPH